jgi:hypothetical protein
VSIYWSGKTTFLLSSLQGHKNWQSITTIGQHLEINYCWCDRSLIVYWTSLAKKNTEKRRKKKVEEENL